jgi:hypothetical protein
MPIYFAQAGEGGPVKIGYAHEDGVISRLGNLQLGNHVRLTLLRVLAGDFDTEWAVHQRFAHLRMHGEWFAYTPEMEGDLGFPDWPPAAAFRKPWPVMVNGSDEHRANLSAIRRARGSPRSDILNQRTRADTLKALNAIWHEA